MKKQVWCSRGKHWVSLIELPESDRIVESGWCKKCHREFYLEGKKKKHKKSKEAEENGFFDYNKKSNYLI